MAVLLTGSGRGKRGAGGWRRSFDKLGTREQGELDQAVVELEATGADQQPAPPARPPQSFPSAQVGEVHLRSSNRTLPPIGGLIP